VIAGLASLDHPLARVEPTLVLAQAFVAVLDPMERVVAGDRYALAARWCARGPFVPFAWRDRVREETLSALDPLCLPRIRDAIAASADQVELLFQFAQISPLAQGGQSGLEACASRQSPTTGLRGRDYLHERRRAHERRHGVLTHLRACALEAGFTVSIVASGPQGALGLVRCPRGSVIATRGVLETLAAAMDHARVDIAGPLPPFGAGAEVLDREGWRDAERAA
jgi:hypothetical protein